MIELTMLPGKDGDCMLLSYGSGASLRRVLIDAGRAATYPLVKPVLAALGPPGVDLLVVTHVDQDHVLGVLAMFNDPDRVPIGEVWFNGFDHLMDAELETFGPQDGEMLTTSWTRRCRGTVRLADVLSSWAGHRNLWVTGVIPRGRSRPAVA